MGLTDLTALDPTSITLSEHESRALCEAADQHLSVDGVRLSFIMANTWLVTYADEVSVLTERPDWLIGEPLRPNLPRGKDARLVERWMNELQMLLFSHPVNVAREERGLPPINVVWLWGFGNHRNNKIDTVGVALPRPASDVANAGHGIAAPTESALNLDFAHLLALLNGNVSAWQTAWQIHSSEILSTDSIILGDSRPRLCLTPRKPSMASKLTALFQHKPTLEEVLTQLQQQL